MSPDTCKGSSRLLKWPALVGLAQVIIGGPATPETLIIAAPNHLGGGRRGVRVLDDSHLAHRHRPTDVPP